MMNQPYEDGGIAGPRQKGIIDLLRGGSAGGQIPAMGELPESLKGNPSSPMMGGEASGAKNVADLFNPQAGPTLQGPSPLPGANDFPGGASPGGAPSPAMDFGRLAGYDQGKFDANKQDAKYQMGRVLAGFDPRQGVTPEVLAALNGLGYGNFSGSGQHLSLSGLTDKGRQNKLSGDYQNADVIQGFSGGNGKWQHSDPIAEAAQAQSQPQQGGGGMSAPSAMGNISGMLHGDAQANIQQALGALQQPGMLQQLIAALQGGR